MLNLLIHDKKAEIIPDNLHRIMPAKGENTAQAPPGLSASRRKEYKSGFYLPRIFSPIFL
jgi:hypothetical protein